MKMHKYWQYSKYFTSSCTLPYKQFHFFLPLYLYAVGILSLYKISCILLALYLSLYLLLFPFLSLLHSKGPIPTYGEDGRSTSDSLLSRWSLICLFIVFSFLLPAFVWFCVYVFISC